MPRLVFAVCPCFPTGFVVLLFFCMGGLFWLSLVRPYDVSIRLPRSLVRYCYTKLRWAAKVSNNLAPNTKNTLTEGKKGSKKTCFLLH